MRAPASSVSDQLRAIITARGTGHAVARAAGIDPGIINRFLRHERGLTTDTLDRLAAALGLRLIELPRAGRRAAAPRQVRAAAEPK